MGDKTLELPYTNLEIDFPALIDQTAIETLKYFKEENCYYLANDKDYLADVIVESLYMACKNVLPYAGDDPDNYFGVIYFGVLKQILPEEWHHIQILVKNYLKIFMPSQV